MLHWEGSRSGSDLPTDPFELQIQNLCWESGKGALRWRSHCSLSKQMISSQLTYVYNRYEPGE